MDSTKKYPRSYINMEAIVIGLLLGGLLITIDGIIPWFMTHSGPMVHEPIRETALLAVWLMAVVAFCGFELPTFFAKKRTHMFGREVPAWVTAFFARLAVFTLLYMCGQISWGFDSFAVILLLLKLKFIPYEGKMFFSHRFSVFVVMCIATMNALTAGSSIFTGELWAVAHYLASGMGFFESGLPMAVVMIPYTVLTSLIGALLFPVRIQHVPFDKKQWVATLSFSVFLATYIFTHRIVFSVGVFLLYVSATGQVKRMIEGLLHELREGGFVAFGIVLAALCIKVGIPGSMEWFAANVTGWKISVLSFISSPFAGAVIAPSTSYQMLYENISWLSLLCGGAVSSSLVGIMVFRNRIDVQDLPRILRGIPGISRGPYAQEAMVYMLVVAVLIAILAPMLYVANTSGILAEAGEYIMGPWPGVVEGAIEHGSAGH